MSAVFEQRSALPRKRDARVRATTRTVTIGARWRVLLRREFWIRVAWTVLTFAILAALAMAVSIGWQKMSRAPITAVTFLGDIDRIDAAELKRLTGDVKGRFGDADLVELRNQARRMPWVREATVRRQFPDRLVISLEAHRPMARWGEAHIINSYGERYASPTELDLPRLVGAEGREITMLAMLRQVQAALAPTGIALTELRLSTRGAWQIVLATGAVIDLGRADAAARLDRFIASTREMPELTRSIHIDLRHERGFAVRHAPAPTVEPNLAAVAPIAKP
jgi:cell division protein FtsQ